MNATSIITYLLIRHFTTNSEYLVTVLLLFFLLVLSLPLSFLGFRRFTL